MAITYSDFLTQVRNYTEVSSNVLSDTLIQTLLDLLNLMLPVKLIMMILENILHQHLLQETDMSVYLLI